MRSAGVGQLDVLSELFAEALAICRPASVAVLGIAGGNGLEHVDPAVTTRVVGVDLNSSYLAVVQQRFAGVQGLELHCADLAEEMPRVEPVDMVHAALVFEHAGAGRCLENALALVAPGGSLSVVLQLPSQSERDVSPSSFTSMQGLGSHFALVDPEEFGSVLRRHAFRMTHESRRSLPAGKGFWMGIFGAAGGLSPRQAR